MNATFQSTILVTIIALIGCCPLVTPEERLKSSDYWSLAWADTFQDGGSIALGLVNENGHVLYVWAVRPLIPGEEKKFFLKTSYNDPKAVEITPGSGLEADVLHLLANADVRETYGFLRPYAKAFHALLEDRSGDFILDPDPGSKDESD